MPMTNFDRDFARMFPEDDKALRLGELERRLADEVLKGDYTNISRDALEERMSDTESFWNALQSLVITYNTKPDEAKPKLDCLMGVISGLAFVVALDASPEIENKLLDLASEELAAEHFDRISS